MARALLFLKAADSRGLVCHLRDALECGLAEKAHIAARLMQRLRPDPLHNPDAPHENPDIVVEVLTSPGLAFTAALPTLCDTLAQAPAEREHSLALLMHQRVYVPCATQPFNFHYLMLRKDTLSPADYLDYYSHYHGRFGVNMQGIDGYSQNYIDQPGSKQLCQTLGLAYREVTSISEMNAANLENMLSSPAMSELAAPAAEDEARFVDREHSVMFSSQLILETGDIPGVQVSLYPQHFDTPQLS